MEETANAEEEEETSMLRLADNEFATGTFCVFLMGKSFSNICVISAIF